MKKDDANKTVVTIPEGYFCAGYVCADCIYMDLRDKNKYGECYCGEHRKYYPPSDLTCSSFEVR